MTREEAYIWNTNSHDVSFSTVDEMEESIHYLLKKIYDSLENRNCSNCKHTDDEYFDLFCINPDVINQHNDLFENGQSMYDNFKVSANFSCNKWELR